MRKIPEPVRTGASPYPAGVIRRVATHIGDSPGAVAAGGLSLVLLSILFWLIFFQNLPPNLGLREPAAPTVVTTPTSVAQADAGNTVDRVFKICMIAMSLYVIATRWTLTRSLVKHLNVGAVAFLLLAPMSAIWSIQPSDTLLRCISLSAIVLVCLAVSLAGWDGRRFQQLVLPPVMFILLASLVLGVMFPREITEIGDDLSLKDAWHGITLTKNQFGMTASIGAIICVNRWLSGEGRIPWAIAGTAASFACLILSRSNTSLFAAMLAILCMVMVMRVPVIRQRFSTHVVVAMAATLLLYELVIQNVIPGAYTLLAPIRGLTGKDATFSARTIIWDIVKEHAQRAPWLGTGYGAYWVGPLPTSPSYVFVYRMYFYPTEAHNGYLDVINDLGYVGLICILVFLFAYIRQALQLMRIDRAQGALYLGILFQQMVMNMSESEWLARDSIFTIVILAIFCMARGLRESRQPARVDV
jgi:O-antigen ligase